ncbi:MAG: hypothetical protein FWF38_02680 [Spirochaetaceae bacterium]|nr:hypothetical protein [Spirochaetaceae bacterium]
MAQLTFTNFLEKSGLIEGMWIIGTTNDGSDLFFAASKPTNCAKGVRVTGDSISLNVYQGSDFVPYTESIIIPAYALNIYDFLEDTITDISSSMYLYYNTVPITFLNGNANIDFAAQMELMQALMPKLKCIGTGLKNPH